VAQLFHALEVREALIAKFAVIAGMRPGEYSSVYTWQDRRAQVPPVVPARCPGGGVRQSIEDWRPASGNPEPDEWIFPSEKGTTPMTKDNCWRR